MTVPILLPVIAETDIDLLWFGVFISMLCTVGTISPPVGLSVYAVSGATGVPSGPVFRYALWIALVTTAIVAVVMILFPPQLLAPLGLVVVECRFVFVANRKRDDPGFTVKRGPAEVVPDGI